MNRRGDEYGEVIDIIADVTRYQKQYPGQVIDDQDELARGRVKISVPELGWFKPSESPWVEHEYGYGVVTPTVGDFVVLYFMSGDVSRPIYRSKVGEFKNAVPTQYTGPNTKVIFQHEETSIIYDSDSGEFIISGPAKIILQGDAIEINGNSKAFVTHTELNTALQTFVTALNTTFASKLNGGGSPGTLSLNIASAATTTLKTGG